MGCVQQQSEKVFEALEILQLTLGEVLTTQLNTLEQKLELTAILDRPVKMGSMGGLCWINLLKGGTGGTI